APLVVVARYNYNGVMKSKRCSIALMAAGSLLLLLASCGGSGGKTTVSTGTAASTISPVPSISGALNLLQAREKVKHVVIIMQENRSFDHYFGTFPGADGIPMQDGQPSVCVP